ncbi:MAG: gliding motility protein GldM [Paludibacteraceae bacterium]|nr:gliding motility protein GldM [Paludibacteraceae bacterium]
MSGAKNCPETPRQKMIGMMYLVLTAMLALNVSADILKGYQKVDDSLHETINSTEDRNEILMKRIAARNEENPAKVGEWFERAKEASVKSDELFEFIKKFKYEILKIADGSKADPEGVNVGAQDNTHAAHEYAITSGNYKELKKRIDEYGTYVTSAFAESLAVEDQTKAKAYEKLFSTEKTKNREGENIAWEMSMFSEMPLAASIAMLTKYQSDIRSAEADLIQYFMSQTEAKDFKVNSIEAVVIPESKNVVSGGQYRGRIILAAVDTTATPRIVVGGSELKDPKGNFSFGASGIGDHKIQGTLYVKDPVTGEDVGYNFSDDYTVMAPAVTIANTEMNVVYMGYSNKISISVPGIPSEKLSVSCPNATLEKTGSGNYICKPKTYQDVVISVSATIDGKTSSFGSQKFRVKTLPDPTAFLRFKDANGNYVLYNPNINSSHKLSRANLQNAELIAEYADGLLQATFRIASFNLLMADGRGGFSTTQSDGPNFTSAQRNNLMKVKSGTVVVIDKIKVTGAKTTTLSFPTIALP